MPIYNKPELLFADLVLYMTTHNQSSTNDPTLMKKIDENFDLVLVVLIAVLIAEAKDH